jgi:hypothetical protein
MHHDLKLRPCYFDAKVANDKPFEIRQNIDRDFQRHDTVTFHEADSEGKVTGRFIEGIITYVTNYEQPCGQVVFGHSQDSVSLETL